MTRVCMRRLKLKEIEILTPKNYLDSLLLNSFFCTSVYWWRKKSEFDAILLFIGFCIAILLEHSANQTFQVTCDYYVLNSLPYPSQIGTVTILNSILHTFWFFWQLDIKAAGNNYFFLFSSLTSVYGWVLQFLFCNCCPHFLLEEKPYCSGLLLHQIGAVH